MENYIETIYDTKTRPVTTYPNELVHYLVNRFEIKEDSKILDLGCGRGDFLWAFHQESMEVYGADMSQDIPSKENERKIIYGGINLEEDKLPFEDNFFDIIFTKSVLEHIHKPENFMKECYRVLKPSGRMIAMVPDWHSCIYIYYDDCTHVQPYTQVGLADTLKIFGFKDVTSEKFYQLPIVWRYPIVKLLCKILQLSGPVKKVYKNKFYRFSKELILLGTGTKEESE